MPGRLLTRLCEAEAVQRVFGQQCACVVQLMSTPAPAIDGEVLEIRPGVNAVTIGGTRYEVSNRYKILKAIGHGAYGVVV